MYYYTTCFSLGEAKKNHYIWMLQLQLSALKAIGGMAPADRFFVLADQDTAAVLRQTTLAIPITIVPTEKPKTLAEGFALRYCFPGRVDCSGQIVVHLDLDMLPVRPLKVDIAPDTIAVYPEGPASDSNYCGDSPLINLPYGVSAGFYVYRDGPRVRAIFAEVLKRLSWMKTSYYTIDQPHFNHALSGMFSRGAVGWIPPEFVSFNGHNHRQTARFINCAGEPGDGAFHFSKMLSFFLMASEQRKPHAA